jgi:hypothetical protein
MNEAQRTLNLRIVFKDGVNTDNILPTEINRLAGYFAEGLVKAGAIQKPVTECIDETATGYDWKGKDHKVPFLTATGAGRG